MNSFKLALLGATFLASTAIISGANAADVYGRGGSIKDGPVDYMPAITWTGFYFGAHLGGAFNDDDNGGDDDDTVFLGGLHAGYNWQKPSNIVFGVEGDVSFADDIDYLASIRGRLGFTTGPTLFYATGGAAFLGVEDIFGDDDTLNGWVVGLGAEHKLRENVSLGLEGLYYDFSDDDDFDDADFWAIRARLTYHFTDPRGEPLR
jgi:outer membrane immunogenic protein